MITKNKGKIVARNTKWMDKFYGFEFNSVIRALIVLVMVLVGIVAFTKDAKAIFEKKTHWNTNGADFVLEGYDVTSYFTHNEALMGLEEFVVEYDEHKWLFASEKSMKLFLSAPEMYLPEFGGFCSTAVAGGYTASVKADTAWSIYKGKLYLNYSDSVHRTWSNNKDSRIAMAAKNWPEIRDNLGWGVSANVEKSARGLTENSVVDSIREKFEGWIFGE